MLFLFVIIKEIRLVPSFECNNQLDNPSGICFSLWYKTSSKIFTQSGPTS